jgi:hypothetical protein
MRRKVTPVGAKKTRGDVVQQVVSGFVNATAGTTNEAEASKRKAEDECDVDEVEEVVVDGVTKRRSKFISALIDLYPTIVESGVFLYVHEAGDDDELIVAPEELNVKWGHDFLAHYRPVDSATKAKKD